MWSLPYSSSLFLLLFFFSFDRGGEAFESMIFFEGNLSNELFLCNQGLINSSNLSIINQKLMSGQLNEIYLILTNMEVQQSPLHKFKNLFKDFKQSKDRSHSEPLKHKIRELITAESSNQILSHFVLHLPGVLQLQFSLRLISELIQKNSNTGKIIKEILLIEFWNNYNTKRKPGNQKQIIIKFFYRIILNDEQMIGKLIDSAKNNKQKCTKLLQNLRRYYEAFSHQQTQTNGQYKQNAFGKATEIAIMCIQVVKNHQIMKTEMLANALKILIVFCSKWPQLISRLSALLPSLNALITANKQSGLALKLEVLFIKNTQPMQLYKDGIDLIQNFINYISFRIEQKADLSEELFKIKILVPDQYQRSKRFFESCSEFIYESIVLCQTSNLINRTKIEKLYDLAEQIVFIKNQTVFRNCIKCLHRRTSHMHLTPQPNYTGILKESQQNREKIFNLLIENSFPFYSDDKIAQEVIQLFFKKFFPTMNQVNKAFEKIQLAIENQFQYQFDLQQFNSACVCLCRLSAHFSQLDKQKIINFIKSLLNMTESIKSQNKQPVKWRINDLITVYPFLLKDNQFLHQVVEDLMASRYPFTSKHIQTLYQNKVFNQNFGKALQNFVNKKKILIDHETKMKYWEMILKVEKKEIDSRQPDEWYFHRCLAGKRIFKDKWMINKQYVQQKKKQMLKFPDQYYEQLRIIELLEQQK